ncbi:MAG: hypothetical protein E6R03_17070 [Hyphomicrobiaceae bacterium]|nr:MAG: hypothetical protein E6R03_17070 [Hyphomicrobiaceae bacterium]
MAQSLIREVNHNAVLRSDNVALRHLAEYGGAPNEWWHEPHPIVSNPFAGSGVSLNCETGQDPTQASASGLMKNPICVFSNPATAKYNYYAREFLWNAAGQYGVRGFWPDFWVSQEAIDDAIAPNTDGSDHGWRTVYAPGAFSHLVNTMGLPVVFQGTTPNWSGLFFVGNEMLPIATPWNQRLRSYGAGRVAFKVTLSLVGAAADSFAGVLFRKSVSSAAGQNKHTAFAAPGLHLYVHHNGLWSLNKMHFGASTSIISGTLTMAQRQRLIDGTGLQVEVRTHNGLPNQVLIFFDDVQTATLDIANCPIGPHVALFASTSSGYICFPYRQFYHVGVEGEIIYKALPGAVIESDLKVTKIVPDSDPPFYRANLPGFFLSQTTFPVGQRRIAGFRNGAWQDITDGVYLLSDFKRFFAGNMTGTNGVNVEFNTVTIDGVHSPNAHLLIHRAAAGAEFVVMLNPLPQTANDVPLNIATMRIKANWKMKM